MTASFRVPSAIGPDPGQRVRMVVYDEMGRSLGERWMVVSEVFDGGDKVTFVADPEGRKKP